MVRAMCGRKVVDKKTTQEQIDMLRLKETVNRLAKANGVRLYRHLLRKGDDNVSRIALDLEVSGDGKREKEGYQRRLRRSKWKRKQRRLFKDKGCP